MKSRAPAPVVYRRHTAKGVSPDGDTGTTQCAACGRRVAGPTTFSGSPPSCSEASCRALTACPRRDDKSPASSVAGSHRRSPARSTWLRSTGAGLLETRRSPTAGGRVVRPHDALRPAQRGEARHSPALGRRHLVEKYVVARFCPLLLSIFFANPSLRILGISLAWRPSSRRICSARKPSGFFFTVATTCTRVFAISSGERRWRRPVDRERVAAFGAAAATVGDRCNRPSLRGGPLGPTNSSSEAPRMAARMLSAKDAARLFNVECRGVGIGTNRIASCFARSRSAHTQVYAARR
jgi:hypothetical protein